MYFIKQSKPLKVKPIATPLTKKNVTKCPKAIQRFQFIIMLQLILGINRLYLLQCKNIIFIISCIYTTCLVLTVTGTLFFIQIINTSHFVLNFFAGTEYFVLTSSALFLMRKRFIKFFRNLQSFDEALNIDQNASLTTPITWYIVAIVVLLSYNLMEFSLSSIYVGPSIWVTITLKLTCLGDTVHDLDMLLYSALLVFIEKRLCILKAHAFRLFHVDKKNYVHSNFGDVENLSKNKDLDISSLHKAYDHLHKCSYQLNYAISFTIIIMLFSSAMTNIMLLKNSFILIQRTSSFFSYKQISDANIKVILFYSVGRFSKRAILLVLLCCCSNVTKTQVSAIRDLLSGASTTMNLDKIERRKIKAFLQMTQDNNFAYHLWGVINLNMSLPLKYYFICLTYLIMTYQLSKFIE